MNPTNKDKGFLKIVENNKINNEMNLAKKKFFQKKTLSLFVGFIVDLVFKFDFQQ